MKLLHQCVCQKWHLDKLHVKITHTHTLSLSLTHTHGKRSPEHAIPSVPHPLSVFSSPSFPSQPYSSPWPISEFLDSVSFFRIFLHKTACLCLRAHASACVIHVDAYTCMYETKDNYVSARALIKRLTLSIMLFTHTLN